MQAMCHYILTNTLKLQKFMRRMEDIREGKIRRERKQEQKLFLAMFNNGGRIENQYGLIKKKQKLILCCDL